MPSADIRGTRRKTFKIGGAVFDASAVTGTKTVTLPNADVTLGSGGGGATDHGALTGLADDDHPQYHNNTRGDARYALLGHGHAISDVSGLQSALDGKQPIAAVLTNTTAAFTAAQETKLAGIAAGATVNASDAALRDRSTHTGSQASSTISDFAEAVDDRVAALLVQGSGVTLTYDDAAGTLTVSASVGGADSWTYIKLASDFVTGSATAVDVTGLAFTPAANKSYEFEAVLRCRTATATVGPRPGLAWPGGATDGVAGIDMTSSATARLLANGNPNAALLAAVGGLPNTTQSYPAWISGNVTMGASPSGTVKVQMATETAGTNVTVKAGSYLKYREI